MSGMLREAKEIKSCKSKINKQTIQPARIRWVLALLFSKTMKHIEEIYQQFLQGHPITTDSRQIKVGDLFIALKGENFDGNRYASDALKKGAHLAIIDNPEYLSEGCLLVDDCLSFLQQLAHHHRKQLNIPILGITGTNGKTTTKELCHAVLAQKYNTCATQGNFNNHIGVPLTLLNMDKTTEFGIVEMGANHPGEIDILCNIAEPDFGIITNIGQAHLEGFGNYENIIATKQALYKHVAQKGGIVFVNASDPLLMRLSQDQKRATYGTHGNLAKGEIKQTVPSLVYDLYSPQGHLYIRTHLFGGYNFENAMAASAIGLHFGINPLLIQKAMENYQPTNLRSQLLKTQHNTIILDAYNANPSSMRTSIANFKDISGKHKVLILGEMRELGQASKQAHTDILDLALQCDFEKIFLIGNNFEHCSEKRNFITWFPDTESFMEEIKKTPLDNQFILIKGSRGNRLERIVELL